MWHELNAYDLEHNDDSHIKANLLFMQNLVKKMCNQNDGGNPSDKNIQKKKNNKHPYDSSIRVLSSRFLRIHVFFLILLGIGLWVFVFFPFASSNWVGDFFPFSNWGLNWRFVFSL